MAEHRRDREAGRVVYPVISRRSGGLSLGINLFPDAKLCSFDCPYCEVFPIAPGMPGFSIVELESELGAFLDSYDQGPAPEPLRDICLSGNGEPCLSPHLGGVLDLLARFRGDLPLRLGRPEIVLISNSSGFSDPGVSDLLERFYRDEGLVVWAKLDAGNERLFRAMSGLGAAGGLSFDGIVAGLLAFSRRVPVVVQTMLCGLDGAAPSASDLEDYSALLSRLVREGARVREVHLYTFARPCPSGRCSSLDDAALAGAAAFVQASTGLRVRAFGRSDELPPASDGAA